MRHLLARARAVVDKAHKAVVDRAGRLVRLHRVREEHAACERGERADLEGFGHHLWGGVSKAGGRVRKGWRTSSVPVGS